MSRWEKMYKNLSDGDRTKVNDLINGILREETGFQGKIVAATPPAIKVKWLEIRDEVLANRQQFDKWLQGQVLGVADFTQAYAIFGKLGLEIRQSASFPVPFVPRNGYGGSRGFGADRSKVRAGLVHGACDMVASPGTPVLAVADGIVMYNPKRFFPKDDGPQITFEFAVRHSGFVARYCEIHSVALVSQGDEVRAGQVIAYIGDQPGKNLTDKDDGKDMLHFEMFSGLKSGSLSLNPEDPANGPYYRRRDLIDPTKHLRGWENTAMWPPHLDDYPTRLDSKGRTFLIRPTISVSVDPAAGKG